MSMPYDWEKPKKTGSSPPDPDEDLPHRSGRVHITARQRGADATALGSLALHLPHVLASMAVVFLVSYSVDTLSGLPWWIASGCWVLSGAMVFHRPCERLMARWLFRLRYPTPEEDRKLRSVWREVTARAGVDGNAYQLWIEDSGEINAMAAAGHIVGVTSHSLRSLPSAQLGGVLAHELGHHTRGHAWASLLTFWYALPGRIAWRLLLRLASRVDRLSVGAAAVVIGVLGAVVIALATATYGLVFLPLATPYLVAAVSRRSELRADEHAALLGFAPQLMAVLQSAHSQEESERTAAATLGIRFEEEGMIARLLDSHPDLHTRLHHLQAHLDRK
ncbi:Zn-dependent protease with chaperone function [Streptomyces umbrinus]|uniref:M48 family metalloprotease n=1 Tax=Streptomyces umbrinus TaxID=67370 RepID=UPI00167E0FD6|nr:M48 family metalloprotease [Streptomyces umbrinus]MCR3730238.1 Zn-dependent protease with chaperone function [Streptomyces umbrinus]